MEDLDARKRPVPNFDDEAIDKVVSCGLGLTANEFDTATARSVVVNGERIAEIGVEEFNKVILEIKTEAVKRSEVLEIMASESMENVGGLENLKAWVEKRKLVFTPEAAEYGIDPLKGLLLAGPPGTGKSLSAKAIASVFGYPLIRFDFGKVFQGIVGASEGRMRMALQTVESMAPCVLLCDEIDKGQVKSGVRLCANENVTALLD